MNDKLDMLEGLRVALTYSLPREVRLLEKGLVFDQARLFENELFTQAMPPEQLGL